MAELIDDAQKEPILVTRHGKPVVLITGVDGADLGSVVLEGSRAFWEEIERRRKSTAPRVTIEQLRDQYSIPAPKRRAKKAAG